MHSVSVTVVIVHLERTQELVTAVHRARRRPTLSVTLRWGGSNGTGSIWSNGSSISDAIETTFSGSNFAEEDLAMKVQEHFTHAAQLGWFCRAPFEPNSENVM
jgi:hypothetical protein